MAEKEFNDELQKRVAHIVGVEEYTIGRQNKQREDTDFESVLGLLDPARGERDYDWMSNVSLHEYASQHLTQLSLDVSQYFQTRDFAEVYDQDDSDESIAGAAAAKKLINNTLNGTHLSHYLKFVRAKQVSYLAGRVYAECWWEQKTRMVPVDQEVTVSEPSEDLWVYTPNQYTETQPVDTEVPVIDRFNYDVLDPRNVFTDNKFTYSMREKDWVIIRSESSYWELREREELNGYFNLDKIKNLKTDGETETASETYNKDNQDQRPDTKMFDRFDVLKRYGKFWCIVKDKDEDGNPASVVPGIDNGGNILDNAELVHVVIEIVTCGETQVLIAFHPTPYIDCFGSPFIPIIRGLCYPHPVNDDGFGDGLYGNDIEAAIDDAFNMTIDRTRLAMLSPIIVNKQDMEDSSDQFVLKPGNFIGMNNPQNVKELNIADNIQGGLQTIGMLRGALQQFTSVFPSTMGQLPSEASTSATAVAETGQRSNIRTNFKSQTFEYTFLTELYWMIQNMTFRFAKPVTGFQLMGQNVYDFAPNLSYWYKPLSQSIETDQSKAVKIQRFIQLLQTAAAIQHPDAVKMVNYLFKKIMEYMGEEAKNLSGKVLNEQQQIAPPEQGQGEAPPMLSPQPTNAQPGMLPEPKTNQGMQPQSQGEQVAREQIGAVTGAY